MDKAYEQKYHQSEDDHWWFVTRRALVLRHILFVSEGNRDLKILDIGCSSGRLIRDLINEGFSQDNLYGIDISERGVEECIKLGIKHCSVMDGAEPKFEDGLFDIIVSSDSLEHIEQENKALDHWHRILKPGGKALIYVPAYMFLWSAHDEINHHFRRYRRSELKQKLENKSFKIVSSGYWNFSMFPIIAIARVLQRIIKTKRESQKSDLEKSSALFDPIFSIILQIENYLITKWNISFPFGISTYCIAEKN